MLSCKRVMAAALKHHLPFKQKVEESLPNLQDREAKLRSSMYSYAHACLL